MLSPTRAVVGERTHAGRFSAGSREAALVCGDRHDHRRSPLRRIGNRARAVCPLRLEARRAVLRLGSVEMGRRGSRRPPRSPASRLLGTVRARGARYTRAVRTTPTSRGLFRYVRNPAYLCAVWIIVGQGLIFGSTSVL